MEPVPTSWLYWALAALLLMSAFFSISETSMMALNRYRLKHLVKEGHRGARLTQDLLDNPDRLLGVILLGNNLINSASSVLATVICVRLFGAFVMLTLTVVSGVFFSEQLFGKPFKANHKTVFAFVSWLLSLIHI